MHAGKSIPKSFQERRPLPTARTMHLPHNPVTVHIWRAHGKDDSQEQAEWTIWDQQHTLAYPFSQVSTRSCLGRNSGAESYTTQEGFQKASVLQRSPGDIHMHQLLQEAIKHDTLLSEGIIKKKKKEKSQSTPPIHSTWQLLLPPVHRMAALTALHWSRDRSAHRTG